MGADDSRRPYPHLQGLSIPDRNVAPWRSGVLASPGRDAPDLVERAFERHNLLLVGTWAQQDARRAAKLALSAKDLDRRRTGPALMLPWYAKVDSMQAQIWRLELERYAEAGNTGLDFEVALIGAAFRLGHSDEAQKLAWAAWKQALTHGKGNLDDADWAAVQDMEDVRGQFWFGDAGWYAEINNIGERDKRLMLFSGYARGALRNSAGYQEPS